MGDCTVVDLNYCYKFRDDANYFVAVVTFSHRSVFPVMFDGTSVEKWWKAALVFKVFSRSAGLKVVYYYII